MLPARLALPTASELHGCTLDSELLTLNEDNGCTLELLADSEVEGIVCTLDEVGLRIFARTSCSLDLSQMPESAADLSGACVGRKYHPIYYPFYPFTLLAS